MGLLEMLSGVADKAVGKGHRGAFVRGLLNMELPEDASTSERDTYRNAVALTNTPTPLALAAAPAAIIKATKAAPRAEALETARKNAVKMLGLPENNTAMDRARALGFRSEQFHETTAPRLEQISQQGFNPRNSIAAASDNETPYGVFTKNSGRSIGLARESEVQLPLLVRTNEGTPAFRSFRDRADISSSLGAWNPEISRLQAAQNMDEAARAKQIDALGEMLGTRAHPNTSGMSNAEIWKQIDDLAAGDTKLSAQTKDLITKELRARGIETVHLAKDAGSMGRSTETTISLNPANIRSRFAAFDPARVNENDLLGRADPRLLALIAAGASVPVGYGLLNKDEK